MDQMAKTPAEPPLEPEADDSLTGDEAARLSKLVGWSKTTAKTAQDRAQATLDSHRHRAPVDLGLRILERDREAAGSVVGSAIAFRLFLFFVPMLLFLVGLAGFVSRWVGRDEIEDAGITGNLAGQINDALSQPNSTRWIATAAGLFGMISAGRTLSKALAAASCLSWNLPVRTKASARAVGATVGLVIGIALVATIVSRIRQELGVGVAGVSFLAAFGIYVVAWLLLLVLLPRGTSDPASLLPGAVLLAATLAGMQAVSQLYLPDRFNRASEIYGAVGVAIVTLGWFFIMGRVTVLGLTLNAVVYERFGSISGFVWSLPILRAAPRRWPRFRRFFQLPEDESIEPTADGSGSSGEAGGSLAG